MKARRRDIRVDLGVAVKAAIPGNMGRGAGSGFEGWRGGAVKEITVLLMPTIEREANRDKMLAQKRKSDHALGGYSGQARLDFLPEKVAFRQLSYDMKRRLADILTFDDWIISNSRSRSVVPKATTLLLRS